MNTPSKKLDQISLTGILSALPTAAIVSDSSQNILACNESASRWFDKCPIQMLGLPLWEFLKQRDDGKSYFIREGSNARAIHGEIPNSLGSSLWTMRSDDDDSESLNHREATRHLAERLEAERLRLARELHDGALQELIGIGFGLAALRRNLGKDSEQTSREAVARIRDDSLGVARLLRAVVSELRPPGLQEFGLAQALEGLVAKLSRDYPDSCPSFDLNLEEVPDLSMNCQVCLFRCAKEALNNCLRHARAKHISLELKSENHSVSLQIQDDGVGFSVPAQLHHFIRTAHYGLAGMAERVALMSGELKVHSTSKTGTLVSLSIPNP